MRRIALFSPLLLFLAGFLLSGCEAAQSTFNTQGPAAHRIATLSWIMVIIFLITTAVMWGLLAWASVHRKGTLEEHEPIDIGGGQGWIAWGGLAVPLAVICFIFVLGLRLLASFPIHDPMNQKVIKPDILVIGHQWWWEVHYLDGPPNERFVTANEIHIPANKPIMIELESHDVIHAFWIPTLHGKVDMIPGHPNFVRIEASHAGNFAGQCAEYCGEQHAMMRLLVVAQDPADYDAWVRDQLQPAAEPTDAEAKIGEQVFMNAACMLCHQIRGTLAGGTVAPDLTHLASRQFIGANTYPNNEGYLAGWVTHAQSMKPDCLMPDITAFNGTQLQDLVTYLRQLK